MRVLNKFTSESFKSMVIGDWGLLDNETKTKYYDVFPCLQRGIEDSRVVMMMFLGDLAYELTDDNCQKYRSMMEAIENFTSVVPFMVSPGNHDTRNQSYQLFTNTFFTPYW
mgnify:CR=1 FL=1